MISDKLNLLAADQKNIFRGALAIFVLGAALFYFTLKVYLQSNGSKELLLVLVIPCIYILSGIFGIYAAYGRSFLRIKAYRIALHILIVVNVISCCLGILFTILFISSYKPCDHATSDSCGLADFIFIIIIVASVLNIIISSSLIALFLVFLKQTKAFNQDLAIQEVEL